MLRRIHQSVTRIGPVRARDQCLAKIRKMVGHVDAGHRRPGIATMVVGPNDRLRDGRSLLNGGEVQDSRGDGEPEITIVVAWRARR